MGEIDLDQVVNNLSNVLGITASEGGKRREAYEKKVQGVYKSPIVEPLKKLEELLDADSKERVAIIERAKLEVSDKTLAMRKELANLLNPMTDKEPLSVNKRNLIAKWIVETWGGIPAGKDDKSLSECIRQADKSDEECSEQFDFNRIASWSKYLAFKKPEKYAIYDARVIYSLNWLLYQSDETHYFPFLSGRNSVMELLDYQLYLFLGNGGVFGHDVKVALAEDVGNRRKISGEQSEAEPSTKSYFSNRLKKTRKLFINDRDAFWKYCRLLQELSVKLFTDKDMERLTKTEMLLFAIADAEIAESVLEYISSLATGVTAKRHI